MVAPEKWWVYSKVDVKIIGSVNTLKSFVYILQLHLMKGFSKCCPCLIRINHGRWIVSYFIPNKIRNAWNYYSKKRMGERRKERERKESNKLGWSLVRWLLLAFVIFRGYLFFFYKASSYAARVIPNNWNVHPWMNRVSSYYSLLAIEILLY